MKAARSDGFELISRKMDSLGGISADFLNTSSLADIRDRMRESVQSAYQSQKAFVGKKRHTEQTEQTERPNSKHQKTDDVRISVSYFDRVCEALNTFLRVHPVFVSSSSAPSCRARILSVAKNHNRKQSSLLVYVSPPAEIQDLFDRDPQPDCLRNVRNGERHAMHLSTFMRIVLRAIPLPVCMYTDVLCVVEWNTMAYLMQPSYLSLSSFIPTSIFFPQNPILLIRYVCYLDEARLDPLKFAVFQSPDFATVFSIGKPPEESKCRSLVSVARPSSTASIEMEWLETEKMEKMDVEKMANLQTPTPTPTPVEIPVVALPVTSTPVVVPVEVATKSACDTKMETCQTSVAEVKGDEPKTAPCCISSSPNKKKRARVQKVLPSADRVLRPRKQSRTAQELVTAWKMSRENPQKQRRARTVEPMVDHDATRRQVAKMIDLVRSGVCGDYCVPK